MSQDLSAYILSYNEEENVPGLMDSLQGVRDIVVLDNDSTDRTVELFTQRGPRVFDGAAIGKYAATEEDVVLFRERFGFDPLFAAGEVFDHAGAGFEPVSWEAALGEIAERLEGLRDAYGPAAALYYEGSGSHGALGGLSMAERHREQAGLRIVRQRRGHRLRHVPRREPDPRPLEGVARDRREPFGRHFEPGQRALDADASAVGQIDAPDFG